MPGATGKPAATNGIAAAVEARLDRVVEAAVEAIWEQVAAYRSNADGRLREDVRAHVRSVFQVFLAALADGREARRRDFAVTRDQATHRVAQGIALADYLQAFRIGQSTLWQSVLDAAGSDPAAHEAALSLVAQLMQVIEVGSTVAAEAYIEAQQLELAEGDRVRRDLLEDLLARRSAPAGHKTGLLHTAGLTAHSGLLVASAVPVGATPDERTLRDAAAAVRRMAGGGTRGLAVVRQDEIVAVAPLPQAGATAAVANLRSACADLEDRHIRLAVGLSTVHLGLNEVPEAYGEARAARDGLGTGAGCWRYRYSPASTIWCCATTRPRGG